tara:strand:+ start:2372 stop:2935 length:564 start_codon:yes stop_codon:yes gene_type:complete
MICIIPSIKNYYKDQFEISVDLRLIKFCKKFYKKKVTVLTEINNLDKNCDLLVISGGNTIYKISKKKKDLIRSKFDNFYLREALKKKISILGICHGAQFVASIFNSKIKPIKNHVGNHYITYQNKKYLVNSFHEFGIFNLDKNFQKTSFANDKSIESYIYKSKKIIGVMWHPERYKVIKKLDKIILK